MSKFNPVFRGFVADEEGVTALEYALLAALIALVIVGTLSALGVNLSLVFDGLARALA